MCKIKETYKKGIEKVKDFYVKHEKMCDEVIETSISIGFVVLVGSAFLRIVNKRTNTDSDLLFHERIKTILDCEKESNFEYLYTLGKGELDKTLNGKYVDGPVFKIENLGSLGENIIRNYGNDFDVNDGSIVTSILLTTKNERR